MTDSMLQAPYNDDFFIQLQEGSQQSAEIIVPIIMEWIKPTNVIDIGCGDGTWLSVFRSHGVNQILGIDGSYIRPSMLQIPADFFLSMDLSQPILLDHTFELAVSLEVAEHLPKESAQRFVESLVRLSSVVLFSAAIPHQGGTHHVNEQWPSYWIKQFDDYGFVAVDALRERIWNHPKVEPWYAQNSLLFVQRDCLKHYPDLELASHQKSSQPLALVHPSTYLSHCPSIAKDFEEATGDKQLQLAYILSLSLNPSTIIQTGSKLIVEIRYRINAGIDTAMFSLSLSTKAGQILIDVNTEICRTEKTSTVQAIHLQIEHLDLAPGKYFINPGIFSVDWTQTYTFLWHRYSFEVDASTSQKGLLQPPIHWYNPEY